MILLKPDNAGCYATQEKDLLQGSKIGPAYDHSKEYPHSIGDIERYDRICPELSSPRFS